MDAILNVIINVINFLQGIDPKYYYLAGALVGLSGVQELAKHTIQNDTRKLSDGTNVAITAALSGVLVAGDTFLSTVQATPGLLTVKEAAAVGGMTIAWRTVVKPLSESFRGLLADAREYRAQKAAATTATTTPESAPAATDQQVG